MPVAHRAGSYGGNTGVSSASFSVDHPVGLATDDVVFIAVHGEDNVATNPTATITGFTEIASHYTAPVFIRLFRGTGFSGAGSWTVNMSAAAYVGGAASAWSGADSTALVIGTAVNAAADGSGNFTVPSVTTAEAGVDLLVFLQRYSAAYPVSTTPSYTQRSRGGNVSFLSIDDASVGATGTVAGVAAPWNLVIAYQIAIPEGAAAATLPEAISDLAAVGGTAQVALTWTAPDPGSGTISDYEVEYKPAGGGNFQVSGTQILDPAGVAFYPFGANTGLHYTPFPYPFRFTDVPQTGAINSYEPDPTTFPSRVEQARTWGWNFLRTNVIAFNDDPNFIPYTPTAAGHADLIAHGVNELLDAGFVVMMDGRTNQPGDNTATLGSTNDTRARQFVTRCLELWGDNPLFWINPFNEPFGGESGGEIASMLALYSDWIPFLRGLGYQNPIVFDLPRYAQAINKVNDGSFDSLMAEDDNLILSWHNYGYVSAFAPANKAEIEAAATAAHAKGYCYLIGEVGYQWNGGSPIPGGYNANVWASQWAFEDGSAQSLDMGVCAWHAGHDEFNVTSNRLPFFSSPNDGTGLNSFGDMVWDRGQALYAGRAIAGKYDAYTVGAGGAWTPFADGVSASTGATVTGL